MDSPVYWLKDECLPEITFLDDTCYSDHSMSDKENDSDVHSPVKHNGTTASDSDDKMVDLSESMYAPVCFLDVRYFPEITLLDVTRDSELLQFEELSSMEVIQDISPVDSLKNSMPPSEFNNQIVAEPCRSDMIQREELPSSTLTGNVTHTTISFSERSDKSEGGDIRQTSLEVTQDISTSSVLENSRPSLEPSGPNMVKIQTSAEDTSANVTHNKNSSSDMAVQCAASQLSTSDMQCNTSLKNVTFELYVEPVVNSNTVEANNEELLTSHDVELTSNEPQPRPKTSGFVNGAFTSLQAAQLSSSTDLSTTAQIQCPQNKTLDLPQFNVNSPNAVEATSVFKNITETSLEMNQNCSAVKTSGPGDMQNATFDRHSLQKSSVNTILGDAGATTFCLQNNTFDTKPPPKQNGTITLSESGSSDGNQNTFDKPSPNATSSPKENNSEVHHPEPFRHNGTTATDPNAKMVDTPESTFEANPAVAVASGAGRRDTKDHSQSGLPVTNGLSNSLGHQSMDLEKSKANTLNWDDTLDLKADSLITSTPMTNRKTFLPHPAAESLLLPSSAASQLLKHKPPSALPGRFEALTLGLPMTRQRTLAEALRYTSASDPPQTTGISSSYKLRATTGSKQPHSGLQRPQLSGILSGIQRAATGLRPQSVRNNTSASLSSNKLCGPTTATNPMTKTSQANKQRLTRGEAMPIAKRKKIDTPLPYGSGETSPSSCDAANASKNLKRPTTSKRALPAKNQRDDAAMGASTAAEISTSCDAVSRAKLKLPASSHKALLAKPQGHGCANCVMLEQQLKMQSEEIRKLNEELLKKSPVAPGHPGQGPMMSGGPTLQQVTIGGGSSQQAGKMLSSIKTNLKSAPGSMHPYNR
ncbi:uncharacterized protein LOC115023825 isoform X2 [Cottoperca gobio]|uniref:Uncharacterized protein LOC115023825 isoform X2 n=1 Tax=Cottoperca gobio TaxID=56716 RepID=A0A6J2RNA3_COTGO|nr:uncharacterized protein LOC115023825 isoform X2 [Cottoperca gobio]